jgi:hypothetical protein
LRVIVTGLVGLHPVGGVAWDYLQYLLGFARLGHDVYYHEDTWSWPYHPLEKSHTADPGYSARYIGEFFRRYAPELGQRWHYFHLHESSHGMSRAAFDRVARSADLFVNVSGASLLPESLAPGCIKIFLDTDPGYNQIVLSEKPAWSENVERWCALVADHDVHFTYAENIDGDDCQVPKAGYRWVTTRMPVVTELWERIARPPPPSGAPWTTIMTWNAFKGPLLYRGREYKSKGAEFKKFLSLPGRVDSPMKVAVGGKKAPFEQLHRHGWQVQDGPTATLTPQSYQALIGGSRGEFSTAKHVYVATRSGWFSCRSACYLAAGRPVVVQDTGFSGFIPTGEGILPFTNLSEAAEAVREAEGNFERHSKSARDVAAAEFAAEKVLERMLVDATKASAETPRAIG